MTLGESFRYHLSCLLSGSLGGEEERRESEGRRRGEKVWGGGEERRESVWRGEEKRRQEKVPPHVESVETHPYGCHDFSVFTLN